MYIGFGDGWFGQDVFWFNGTLALIPHFRLSDPVTVFPGLHQLLIIMYYLIRMIVFYCLFAGMDITIDSSFILFRVRFMNSKITLEKHQCIKYKPELGYFTTQYTNITHRNLTLNKTAV